MQVSEIIGLQVHDLVQIDLDLLDPGWTAASSWVRRALRSCPWAVVRRPPAPLGQIAVGVRGRTRSERWGEFVSKDLIRKIVQPEELLALERSSRRAARTPALRALRRVIEQWRDLTLPWGPIGSVGFELATRRQVTTEASDLDLVIRAEQRISVRQARSWWERVIGLATKVDARVETPECGFSLEEYACTSARRILLRFADGVRFGDNPWGPTECRR
jgi:phosphoribosyl-dephospho-CoA transferase